MARVFDGTYDALIIAPNSALSCPDGSWALGGWMQSSCNTNAEWLYGHGQFYGTSSCNLYTQNGNIVVCVVSDSGCIKAIFGSGHGMVANTWYHVLINNDVNDLTLYLDGVAKWNDATETNWDTVSPSGNAAIGAIGDSCGNTINGRLAEWARWDAALTSEQIAGLVAGIRPVDIGTQPAWYLPLVAGLEEGIAGLELTNYTSVVGEHPPNVISAGSVI